jgi:hypothetical protein
VMGFGLEEAASDMMNRDKGREAEPMLMMFWILCWEMVRARFSGFVSNVDVRPGSWWHEEKSSWILLHRIHT